jgi:hypothetical protein
MDTNQAALQPVWAGYGSFGSGLKAKVSMQQQSKENGIGECPVDMTATASAAITTQQDAPASA